MFDFFYVNKIRTNLAVQSHSLHVKQKIAPLRRKEPKPYSAFSLHPSPQPFSVTTAFLPMNVLFRVPVRESLQAMSSPLPTTLFKMFSDQDKGYGVYAESQYYCKLSP